MCNIKKTYRKIGKLSDFVEAKTTGLEKEVIEVSIFPTKNIPYDGIFTFSPETAKKVTDYTHGIHEYPAKFIPQIPRWAIYFSNIDQNDVLLDPFAGCGTSLVEARLHGVNSYGIDINPLSQLLTEVKTTPLQIDNPKTLESIKEEILREIKKDTTGIDLDEPAVDINLHFTWKNWFSEEVMEDLIRIKRNINNFTPKGVSDDVEVRNIRRFLLINLSATLKRVSFLDSSQIKVRKAKDKFGSGSPNTRLVFRSVLERNIPKMIEFTRECRKFPDAWAIIAGDDARNITLAENHIDLVVTSPPYLNAIDYTMAHKYNLFLLDMISPENFKEFCRKFIGMTERVVYRKDYDELHLVGNDKIDRIIRKIHNLNLKPDVDKNRAFILYQYFMGMKETLKQIYHVLKPEARCIIVLGDNRIRKVYVPTHLLVQELAEKDEIGFKTLTRFYHRIRARKLGIARNHTGGRIKDEMVIVLQKPK